ncbi:tryptophan transporter [Inconstantimicrobium mannanitabidum]|uniref:Tryptophan transporter n=1 Tax=Inconstantimicrobium mannanitabidum TaxID=1604901 RepID=A0ACB5RD66_9CLOT|nr:tryptophan transporter [Clostridium sp. TW13]GKX66988.1 tryptophan transporter [Clostridium sp. TW13]
MSTKKIVINSLLLAIGAILHAVTPALGLPMQPDFSLTMLFIIIFINFGDYKTTLASGIITGVFTALTTKFPLGQVPNLIDKVVTANIIFFLVLLLKPRMNKNLAIGIVMVIGTLISGSIFLESASILVGLPASFTLLFTTVVIPAIAINLVAGIILYKAIDISLSRVLMEKSKVKTLR